MSTILLVEDHAWFAEQQQRVLEKANYHVVCAYSPQSAIDSFEQHQPQAIILDMLLAHNTAMALLHELQSYQETAHIPVVLYTAQAEALAQSALASYGVVALLDKTTMRPSDTVRALRRAGI